MKNMPWSGLARGTAVICLAVSLTGHARDGATTAFEGGIRAGGGDGFDAIEVYHRRPAAWLQRAVLDAHGADGFTALWDGTLGYWDGDHDSNLFLAIGPVLEAHHPGASWRFSLGVQPTLISSHNGNGKDLGGPFQFTSHAGVAWAPTNALVVGIRIQHTSNAGLYDHNPGVDIVSAGVGFEF